MEVAASPGDCRRNHGGLPGALPDCVGQGSLLGYHDGVLGHVHGPFRDIRDGEQLIAPGHGDDALHEHLVERRQLLVERVAEGPLVDVVDEHVRSQRCPGDEVSEMVREHLLAAFNRLIDRHRPAVGRSCRRGFIELVETILDIIILIQFTGLERVLVVGISERMVVDHEGSHRQNILTSHSENHPLFHQEVEGAVEGDPVDMPEPLRACVDLLSRHGPRAFTQGLEHGPAALGGADSRVPEDLAIVATVAHRSIFRLCNIVAK